MNVVDNRTTRKDKNKYPTTKIIYDQNSMAIINKIITVSDWHQIKPEINNSTFNSIEKIWNLSSMRLVNKSTKKAKRCDVQKYVSFFLKTIHFTEIPKKFIYISRGKN